MPMPMPMDAATATPKQRKEQSFKSSEALLIGALASGVNGPTWGTLKLVMLALGASLLLLLYVALQYSSFIIFFHVLCLTSIALLLFILLKWFIGQTGLVTLEQQIAELNGGPEESAKEN